MGRMFPQPTNVSETLSQMAEAISGVPQGSVIGPILFVTYVNDQPQHLSADSLLYADDVKLIAPRNRHDILKNSLNSSSSWTKDWELDLNPTSNPPNTYHQRPGKRLKHPAQC